MTKKDYELVAYTLKDNKNKTYILDIAERLAVQFKKNNVKFNTKKFLDIVT